MDKFPARNGIATGREAKVEKIPLIICSVMLVQWLALFMFLVFFGYDWPTDKKLDLLIIDGSVTAAVVIAILANLISRSNREL